MTKTITIPEELRDKVQRADIERSACRDIITYIIGKNDIDLSNERFLQYQQEYNNRFFAFENAKKEVERDYVKKNFNDAISWNLDYNTCEVTVTI